MAVLTYEDKTIHSCIEASTPADNVFLQMAIIRHIVKGDFTLVFRR